jgi:hypothetical protein
MYITTKLPRGVLTHGNISRLDHPATRVSGGVMETGEKHRAGSSCSGHSD